jgi:hypothetical protein
MQKDRFILNTRLILLDSYTDASAGSFQSAAKLFGERSSPKSFAAD